MTDRKKLVKLAHQLEKALLSCDEEELEVIMEFIYSGENEPHQEIPDYRIH